jgi:hypothetical protein
MCAQVQRGWEAGGAYLAPHIITMSHENPEASTLEGAALGESRYPLRPGRAKY